MTQLPINLILDFQPLFYILDQCQHTVLAARKQDRYEVIGTYLKYDPNEKCFETWPASFNSQLPWEFPDRFIISKDESEALSFALAMSEEEPLRPDECLTKYPRSEDFPKS